MCRSVQGSVFGSDGLHRVKRGGFLASARIDDGGGECEDARAVAAQRERARPAAKDARDADHFG